jgi:hypothetical protein
MYATTTSSCTEVDSLRFLIVDTRSLPMSTFLIRQIPAPSSPSRPHLPSLSSFPVALGFVSAAYSGAFQSGRPFSSCRPAYDPAGGRRRNWRCPSAVPHWSHQNVHEKSVDRIETHCCFGYNEAGARESGYQRGSRFGASFDVHTIFSAAQAF